MDRCKVNAALCQLLAANKFEWTRACTPKPTSRMAHHVFAMRFVAQRHEGNAITSPINSYWPDALNGQRLINDEAEHGVQSWAPPMELARLLLMRRDPRTSNSLANGNPRLLGVVVPEIDAVVANSRIVLPSPAKPILPLFLRQAPLAAVAILERQGPFMLAQLEEKMIGQNRSRFRELTTTMLGIPPEPAVLSLLQHN